jgi:hypothetical protein
VGARFVILLAVFAACSKTEPAARIPLEQIAVVGQPALRTSPLGGKTDPDEVLARRKVEAGAGPVYLGEGEIVTASYVLVDAENRSTTDANVTLGGELSGPGQAAPLRRESLFVPAGATRTFLLLDQGLAPRPSATGVKVVVTGAVEARHAPAFDITDFHQMTDGDRVVTAANVVATAKRRRLVIVHAAFHDKDRAPLSRAHAILQLVPGVPQTVRFVGPAGSTSGTIFQGESRDY